MDGDPELRALQSRSAGPALRPAADHTRTGSSPNRSCGPARR